MPRVRPQGDAVVTVERPRILSANAAAADLAGPRVERRRVERRRNPTAASTPTILDFGALRIDLDGRLVTVGVKHVDFTMKEFDLLAFLALRHGTVFTRAELLHSVWHSKPDWQEQSTVTEHVRRIRLKIRHGTTTQRELLRTVRGVGYRFDAP